MRYYNGREMFWYVNSFNESSKFSISPNYLQIPCKSSNPELLHLCLGNKHYSIKEAKCSKFSVYRYSILDDASTRLHGISSSLSNEKEHA